MTAGGGPERRLGIAPSARLRFDKIEARHVLLSPERGLALSDTATEIVRLCDGTRTASEVVQACVARYTEGNAAQIETDVRRVLQELMARSLVVERAGPRGLE
jgi:pyrroloquinoline quinone biosynthesis protein D